MWKQVLIESWSGGKPVPYAIRPLVRNLGLPESPPSDPFARAKLLALLTDMTPEEIAEASGHDDPFAVIGVVNSIPNTAHQIIAAHRKGYTPREMERELGITRTLTYYWLRQVGLKPHRRNRSELTAREVDDILRSWRAGEPVTQIAKRTGASYDQVRYVVMKAQEQVIAR